MENTFHRKSIILYRKIVEKHGWLRVPAFGILAVIIFVHDAALRFAEGWRKCAFTAFLLSMFFMCSSFTYPIFGDNKEFTSAETEVTVPEVTVPEDNDVELAEERNVPLDEPKLLEDEDVLDGYEDSELRAVKEADKYSLEDILENNQILESNQILENNQINDFTFSAEDWRLILINKQHPIPSDYDFNLGTIKGGMQCDERIISDVLAMLQGAKNDGIDLVICSPYRDLTRQERLFTRKIEAYMKKGMSYLEAYRLSSRVVTVPGASEHQIGLAIDIISNGYSLLDEGFAETAAGQWLGEHSYEYGFILRYPKGKEYLTGIEFEPWHFRYVGKEAASVIFRDGLALEEFAEEYL